jgi:hypothetical protein
MAQDHRRLLNFLTSYDLLENSGQRALQETVAQLEGAARDQSWEVKIPSQQSLLFAPSTEDYRLQPDLFCALTGPSDDQWPWKEQSLVIRVWSTHSSISSRDEWDSREVSRALEARNWARVVVRIHLDRADPNDSAPLHHLQVGGKAPEEDRELCWIPPQVKIPRLPYHPMDIILACEIILANFFPSEFSRLRDDTEWQAIVIRSEQRTLGRYSKLCHDSCSHPEIFGKKTLLMSLWNS